MSAVKVLLAGDCLGGFSALFKRVTTVNNKSGPFDLLLCVGQFFEEGDDNEGDIPADLEPYIDGTARLPVPTYFLGACGKGSAATLAALAAADVPAGGRNLHYLGRSGVTVLESLNVAFLDGTFNPAAFTAKPPPPSQNPPPAAAAATAADGDDQPPAAAAEQQSPTPAAAAAAVTCRHYNQADVARLRHQLMVLPGEVDLLLTCEWPAGVMQQLPQGQDKLAGFIPAACSAVAADIAVVARPRYHIAGGQGLFYTRIPYQNPDIGAGPRATRFVSLGSVTSKTPPAAAAAQQQQQQQGKSRAGIGAAAANPQQQQQQQQQRKFLHALGLPPAAVLTVEQLSTLPEGCGGCPYQQQQQHAGGGAKKRAHEQQFDAGAADPSNWRWMQPKKHRGPPTGGPAFQPWGRPRVAKDSSRSVFVKNLPYEATYDDLAAFFSQAGEVEDIRRGAQQDTGRPNPWCHVQFTEAGAVAAACALNGSLLLGREITIATSTPINKPDGGEGGGHQGQRRDRQQQQQQFEPGKPVDGCWFCLSSDQVDINLVASVGEEVYLALDKGPITPQHCLIIPIEHYPSWASLPAAAAAEAGRYLSALRTAAAAGGQQLVGFERYLKLRSKGGNHCHINTVGISRSAGDEAAGTFQQKIEEAGLTVTSIPAQDGQLDMAALQAAVGDGEYFLGVLPDGSGLAAPLIPGQRAPMQLGRQILARLAGVPERSDWKACTSSSEEEKAAADRFRDYFKPYDIMPTAE